MYRHYQTIAESSRQPVIIYHYPERTGVFLEPGTVERLSHIPNLAGMKDSGGDLEVFKRYMEWDSDHFQVMMGIDGLLLEALKLGCTAAISAPSNVIGKILVGIYENYQAGDLVKAEQLQGQFLKFKEMLSLAPSPTIVKEAANIIGLHVGAPSKPLQRPSDSIHRKLEELLVREFQDCFC